MGDLPADIEKSVQELLKLIEGKNMFKIDDRPSWKEYFMGIAELAGMRSTCYGRKVGAVIVRDKRIITTGYNGAASGITSCFDLGKCVRRELKQNKVKERKEDAKEIIQGFKDSDKKSKKCACMDDLMSYVEAQDYEISRLQSQRFCRAQHSEENAFSQASTLGTPLAGADLYITLDPCEDCTKQIISNQLGRVYYANPYDASEKFDAELRAKVNQDRLQSETSFELLPVKPITRLLIAYEFLKGDLSRPRD